MPSRFGIAATIIGAVLIVLIGVVMYMDFVVLGTPVDLSTVIIEVALMIVGGVMILRGSTL
jgi:hypothetical protein